LQWKFISYDKIKYMMKKGIQILVIIGLFFIVFDSIGQGCSQCKLLTKQGSELSEDSFGTNINWGILYLLFIPYILLMLFFRKKIVAVFKRIFKK